MSLSNLLQEAHTTPQDGCMAVICWNDLYLAPARASQHVHRLRRCESTQFVWSEIDNCRICRACWTPEKNSSW